MRYQPSTQTSRLRLRPFISDDAPTVSGLAGTTAVAATATSIPHPFSVTAAKTWIAGLPHLYRTGAAVHFAVCINETKELIGCLALKNIDEKNAHAELEIWIGEPWQRQGYALEAAREVLAFGFQKLKLNRIYSLHLAEDPRAAGLMSKLGLKPEGVMRQAIYKPPSYKDLALSAILRDD